MKIRRNHSRDKTDQVQKIYKFSNENYVVDIILLHLYVTITGSRNSRQMILPGGYYRRNSVPTIQGNKKLNKDIFNTTLVELFLM